MAIIPVCQWSVVACEVVCRWLVERRRGCGAELVVGEGFEEGDEGLFVGRRKMETAVGMLGEVGIEGCGALDVFAVMINDFFQSLEAAIVHVGGGECDVA